jgi:hypothetical protein
MAGAKSLELIRSGDLPLSQVIEPVADLIPDFSNLGRLIKSDFQREIGHEEVEIQRRAGDVPPVLSSGKVCSLTPAGSISHHRRRQSSRLPAAAGQ